MLQGTLEVSKSQKGYVVKVVFEKDGKIKNQPVQNVNLTDTSFNGKPIEFEKDEKGQITKIICDGKEIFSTAQKNKNVQQANNNTRLQVRPQSQREHNQYQYGDHPQKNKPFKQANFEHQSAWSPYNFIPLNEKVIEAEQIPDFNRYLSQEQGRYTGWIDLEIETKTPLYIRDTLTPDEMRKKQDIEGKKEQKEKYINPNFFSPAGKIRIPGSSLRGMIRNLVEIASFGKFKTFHDRRLYFRAVADPSKLGEVYKEIMINESDYCFPKIKAGILRKAGLKYTISPSKMIQGTQIYRINFDKKTKIIDGTTKWIIRCFEFRIVYFQPISPTKHNHIMPKTNKPRQLKYALLSSVSQIQNSSYPNKGYIISSGEFGNKKHMHWVINEEDPNVTTLEITNTLLQSYKDDVNRHEEADLFKQLEKHPEGVPCFYITDGTEKVISFGHTGMFRLAYEKTIGDHVPACLKTNWKITPERLERIGKDGLFSTNSEHCQTILRKLQGLNPQEFEDEKTFKDRLKKDVLNDIKKEKHEAYTDVILKYTRVIDIAEAIFGNEQIFHGRVFFEDAICEKQTSDVFLGDAHLREQPKPLVAWLKNRGIHITEDSQNKAVFIPQILSSPKPTTFQHYLEPTDGEVPEPQHYNTNAILRGYKHYWHKQVDTPEIEAQKALWQEDVAVLKKLQQEQKQDTQHTAICPIKPNVKFAGRIRFENLSKVELGALLFALDLPEGCYHKLGMGKPLGLGSVKITPTFRLSNRENRYKNLFAEWMDGNGDPKETIQAMQKTFEQYILERLDCLNVTKKLWEHTRLQELEIMLNYKKGLELAMNGKTEYMQIEPKGPHGEKKKSEFANRPILPLPSNTRES